MRKMDAVEIKKLLAEKHQGDFFITECKNGPTWFGGHLRLDAIAIKKSWSSPCITGYEVKVSRNDFLRDDKWPEYLQYCNRFFFVCPKGLIKKEDIPDKRVGLIYANESGFLRTVNAVPSRPVDIPAEFYLYIIMCRLDSDRYPFYNSREEYIKAYLNHKADSRKLGVMFGTSLVKRVDEVEEKLRESDGWGTGKEFEKYQKVSEILQKHRIYLYGDWESELNSLLTRTDKMQKQDRILDDLKEMAQKIERLTGDSDG